MLSGEPYSQLGDFGLVDLEHWMLDIGAMAGEHAQERLRDSDVLAQPCNKALTQLRCPWIIEHRLSRSVEGLVRGTANELSDCCRPRRSRILTASRGIRLDSYPLTHVTVGDVRNRVCASDRLGQRPVSDANGHPRSSLAKIASRSKS